MFLYPRKADKSKLVSNIELGRAPVQAELGPLGLFRGRECLFFRFRVAFSLYIRAPEAAQPFGQKADKQDTLITTFGTQGARASERACSACAHAPLSDQRETLVGLPIDAAEPVFCPHIKQVYGSAGLCFGGWSGSFADSTAHSCSVTSTRHLQAWFVVDIPPLATLR